MKLVFNDLSQFHRHSWVFSTRQTRIRFTQGDLQLTQCNVLRQRKGPIARPPACVSGGRLTTCVCHWTPTTAFVGHRHVPSSANQHMSWRSLICCCWTSCMEQSANPAVRVGHYTRTISTNTQNASVWSLTALQRRVTVFFCALCTNLLACLLTYLDKKYDDLCY